MRLNGGFKHHPRKPAHVQAVQGAPVHAPAGLGLEPVVMIVQKGGF